MGARDRPRPTRRNDEAELVRLGGKTLEGLGCRGVTQTDARLALAAFRAAPEAFGLILPDQARPGMSGAEPVRAA